MLRRIVRYSPFAAAGLFFFAMSVTVAGATSSPSAKPMPGLLAQAPDAKPATSTVVQIDAASLVLAAGALGTAIGAGIRSAAKVVTNCMAEQSRRDGERDTNYKESLSRLATLVEKYYTDRGTTADAIGDVAEDMDEIREILAELAGKPKPRRKPRQPKPRPAQGDTDHNAAPVA